LDRGRAVGLWVNMVNRSKGVVVKHQAKKMIKEQIGEFMDEDKIDDVVDYAIDKIGVENVLKIRQLIKKRQDKK